MKLRSQTQAEQQDHEQTGTADTISQRLNRALNQPKSTAILRKSIRKDKKAPRGLKRSPIPPNVRCIVYSYLTFQQMLSHPCTLSRYERRLMVLNQQLVGGKKEYSVFIRKVQSKRAHYSIARKYWYTLQVCNKLKLVLQDLGPDSSRGYLTKGVERFVEPLVWNFKENVDNPKVKELPPVDTHNKRIELSFSRVSSISVPILKKTFNVQRKELVEKLDFSNYVFDVSDIGNETMRVEENQKILDIIQHFNKVKKILFYERGFKYEAVSKGCNIPFPGIEELEFHSQYKDTRHSNHPRIFNAFQRANFRPCRSLDFDLSNFPDLKRIKFITMDEFRSKHMMDFSKHRKLEKLVIHTSDINGKETLLRLRPETKLIFKILNLRSFKDHKVIFQLFKELLDMEFLFDLQEVKIKTYALQLSRLSKNFLHYCYESECEACDSNEEIGDFENPKNKNSIMTNPITSLESLEKNQLYQRIKQCLIPQEKIFVKEYQPFRIEILSFEQKYKDIGVLERPQQYFEIKYKFTKNRTQTTIVTFIVDRIKLYFDL